MERKRTRVRDGKLQWAFPRLFVVTQTDWRAAPGIFRFCEINLTKISINEWNFAKSSCESRADFWDEKILWDELKYFKVLKIKLRNLILTNLIIIYQFPDDSLIRLDAEKLLSPLLTFFVSLLHTALFISFEPFCGSWWKAFIAIGYFSVR